MASAALALQNVFSRLNASQLGAPILIVMILAMMVLPLPAFVLDVLFTFNIALSVLILLVAIQVKKTLEFSVFPTVLLVTTLLRLSLNVASTRVVMLEGHTGGDAAGKVIEAFGHFLVGGNYTVGIIVFLILVIINFMVITKGAGRVAEVSARFTLDAMPGKQMAIDADLNAGLIGEDEARQRRSDIAREAEFFGSMDGASKFVRGDAIAGIIITLINIIGGLVIGVVQHDLALGDAAKNYTLLAIGDGLVAQIPSLVISIAAGMVVTRVSDERDVSAQFAVQVFRNHQVVFITAGILGGMGLIPGMPNLVFLLLAGGLSYLGWKMLEKSRREAFKPVQAPVAPPPVQEAQEASWSDVAPLDVLGLEVGYRLIPLVDKTQDGELLRRIRGIRKKFAQEVGFLVSPVHIRDNLELKPNAYRILLKGVEVGQGEAFPGQFLAINPGRVAGTLPGTPTKDPAFGLAAVWVDAGLRDQAQAYGYTVVDASTVVATHLNHLILTHASGLLGRQEVQQLIDYLAKEMPKLVEDLVPKILPLGTLQKVLQNLLEEGVHIRDMRTIIETLADHATRTQSPDELTAQVRTALGRAIVQQLYPSGNEMQVMTLDPQLERLLLQTVAGTSGASALEPGLADGLLKEAAAAAQRQESLGMPPVLLVPGAIRLLLSRFLRRSIPQLKVIAHGEVPETKILKVTSIIGGRS
ncbi:flagellar biosynthesis protein FlhA [Azovibrio restrictus]|uniref:flagellar biosynthesis protein FlhA n=1 Tax=Azovibrio restrictus TaxID=146938 RepID=UPI0026F24E14|nr:flagellar biosynthesis protein FlhA [Azovibrio restrictus]MDD3481914.1 flagellar biosynthesis protein FlhA [Azovibrio restrictus]